MAKVLGIKGKSVEQITMDRFRKEMLFGFLSFLLIMFFLGFGLGFYLNFMNIYIGISFIVLGTVLVVYGTKIIIKIGEKFQKDRLNYTKGLLGETIVGYKLQSLSDDYYVINDLRTPFGNIDHIVIGMSGIYIIETKNFKGLITATESGELLLNGQSTVKPFIGNLTKTVMSIRTQIMALTNREIYIKGLMIFPSAFIKAKWGTTGYINCLSDEGLYNYFEKQDKRLSQKEVGIFYNAFVALVSMDKAYDAK